ncbi:MAG: HAMP domain-containing histidine kinase [Planctomycetes bacterium]|nr:HAMP domain-containing histidine kinase [Planctomycetota bacterium]
MLATHAERPAVAPRTQRLLRSLCHAIRQPLTTLAARAELLEDGAFGEPPPEQRAELAQLQGDCARLASLVQDLCDLMRGDVPLAPAEDADLATIARHTCTALEARAAAARISFELSAPERALLAGINARELRALVARLLEQALRFAPRQSRVQLGLAREGSWWLLSVVDEGPCPLDIHELHSDLDRLQRPDDLHGLVPELALAEAWVRAAGGHFALQRTDVGGLRVALLLPAREGAA